MSNEEQIADTIEMLYKRLNEYHKQDLFNYGYLLESNQILCKDIEEKDKEIERLTAESTEWESKCYKYQDIIDELEKWLKEYIPLLEAGDICEETTQDTLKEVLDKLNKLKEGK